MVELSNVVVRYTPTHAITFHNWQVPQGGIALVLGASGSGKTTLLNVLAGLLPPHQGSVKVAGRDPYALTAQQNDLFRGRSIGLIFQKPHLIPSLSVLENLLAAQYFAQLRPDKALALQRLEELNVGHKQKSKPNELSQGEAQRVAIARAMLNSPALILADEPTSALDDGNCQAVLQLLEQQAQRHKATLIVATHDQRTKDHLEQNKHYSMKLGTARRAPQP